MGRGRAKAKQARVARKLKYTSPDTDFDSLQKELSGQLGAPHGKPDHEASDDDHELEEYEQWADSVDSAKSQRQDDYEPWQ